MKTVLNEVLQNARRRRRRQHRILSILLVLSLLVSLSVTWELHMTGVAQAGEAYCGKEEHEHSEACYTDVLTCELSEEGHRHTEACYTEQPVDCSQPEHTHGAECYTASAPYLVCGQEEGEEHSHSEACYRTDDILSCGQEEHSHSADATQRVLTCTQEQKEVHQHTEACYEKELTCQKEEHVHTAACYANLNADLESAAIWERTLPASQYGTKAERVLRVAYSQIGYTESIRNYIIDEEDKQKGYSRYGAWYGSPYGDWCAMFVSFCLYYAGISQSEVPYHAGCPAWIVELTRQGLYERKGEHEPKPGDLIFMDNNLDGISDHVGLVAQVAEDGDTLTTVEGNWNNQVGEVIRDARGANIMGYGLLERPEEEETSDAEEEATEEEGSVVEETEGTDEAEAVEETEESEEAIEETEETADTAATEAAEETVEVQEETEQTAELEAEETEAFEEEASAPRRAKALALASGVDEDVPLTGEGERDGASFETALDLPQGITVSVTTEGATQKYLRIQPTVTGKYSIYSLAEGEDTYGYLFDSEYHQIAENDNDGIEWNFSINDVTLKAGETYYVGVKWYGYDHSPGQIPVRWSVSPTSPEGAMPLNIGTSDGVTTVGGQLLYYQFTAEEEGTYQFASTDRYGDTTAVLLAQDGETVLAENTGAPFTIQQRMAAGETCYLGVRWANHSSGVSPSVQLSMVDGSSLDTAVDLAPGERKNALAIGSSWFYFRVQPQQETGYRFTTPDVLGQRADMALFDASGTILSRYSSGTSLLQERTLEANQTYYLGVRWSVGASKGKIPVSAETYNTASTRETAYPLPISRADEKKTVSVPMTGEQPAYFRIDPADTHEYLFQLQKEVRVSEYFSTRLLDEGGNEVLTKDRVSSTTFAYKMEGGKTYYLEVKGASATYNSPVKALIVPSSNHNYRLLPDGTYFCTDLCPAYEEVNYCGDKATWRIEDGVLYIEGEGETYHYRRDTSLSDPLSGPPPWKGMEKYFSKVVVGEGITSLGTSLFEGCDLTEAVLPQSLTEIGADAFKGNSRLREVAFPAGLKKIGSYAFSSCQGLTRLSLPERIESIGDYAFSSCSSVTEVEFPSAPAVIGEGVFGYCKALKQISLPEGMTVLPMSTFSSCTALETAVLPSTLRSIGDSAFYNCTALTGIQLPDGLTSLGKSVFNNCKGLKEVVIPEGVASIPERAFYNCTGLERVRLPEGLTSIEDSAFYDCSALWDASLPQTLTRIEHYAFANCSQLNRINIPENITRINLDAFYDATHEILYQAVQAVSFTGKCDTPQDLIVGQSVRVLPSGFVTLAVQAAERTLRFEGPNVMTISQGALDSEKLPLPLRALSGPVYVDAEGALYRYDAVQGKAELVYVPMGKTAYTVPAVLAIPGEDGEAVGCTVTAVGECALSGADSLKTLTFETPENITALSSTAFSDCPTLTCLNGETWVEKAKETFSSAEEKPASAFYHTGLRNGTEASEFTREQPAGQEVLTHVIQNQGTLNVIVQRGASNTLEYTEGEEGGSYQLLTGDSLHFLVTADTRGATVFPEQRVYLETTRDDVVLPFGPGESRTYRSSAEDGGAGSEVEVTCHATDIPGVYYYAFRLAQGGTVSFPLIMVYPSPTSEGGGVRLWTEVVEEEESTGSDLSPAEETIEAWWRTQNDQYQLEKTFYSTSSSTRPGLLGDGKGGVGLGGGTLVEERPALQYKLVPNRTTVGNESYGRDITRSLTFTDRLLLPEGITWSKELLAAVEAGKWSYEMYGSTLIFYVEGQRIAKFAWLNRTPQEVSLEADENGQLRYSFRLVNNSRVSQMTQGTIGVTIFADDFQVDLEGYQDQEDKAIRNEADLEAVFTYAKPQTSSDAVEYVPSNPSERVSFQKTINTNSSTMGGYVNYDLTFKNEGIFSAGLTNEVGEGRLTDSLNEYLYLTEEGMERMLRDPYGKDLTITITGAMLADAGGSGYGKAWAVDGSRTASITPWNTEMPMHAETLVICWQGEAITVNGVPVSGSLEAYLRSIGYAQTDAATTFNMTWDLTDEEENQLCGGETRVYQVYATYKNTFQYHATDWLRYYPQYRVYNKNTAYWNTTSSSEWNYAYREAEVTKGARVSGEAIDSSYSVVPGEILEYVLNFSKESYSDTLETLPMVDYMGGGHRLLVPVRENPGLAGYGFPIVEDGGISYYKINQPGRYDMVWVGTRGDQLLMADNVQVSEDGSVEIRWYFKNVGVTSFSVAYKTMVEPIQSGSSSFTLSNVVFMNDKVGNRIYDPFWTHGTIIDFDKKIQQADGSLVDYSRVQEGETVTYRLRVKNLGGETYVVSGGDAPGAMLYDVLPDTTGIADGPQFAWEKDVNVRLRYTTQSETIECNGLDEWSIEPFTWTDETTKTEKTGYRIVWPKTSNITFRDQSELFFYVELDFPTGDGWFDYVTAVNGRQLKNTFWCCGFPDIVYHDLVVPAVAELQKGVAGTGRVNSDTFYPDGNRNTYANQDVTDHYVEYYVALYNDGDTRLYLNPLVDTLPQGFVFYRTMSNNIRSGGTSFNYSTVSNNFSSDTIDQIVRFAGREVRYPSCTIRAVEKGTVDGVQTVEFIVEGDKSDNALSYDEGRGQYYLNPNEAVVFAYTATTNTRARTQDVATNSIRMAYTDYLKAGIRTSDVEIEALPSDKCEGQNDGDHRAVFQEEDEKYYLTSQVEVSRGEYIPGINKQTYSTTVIQGSVKSTEPYGGAARDDAIVNWRVNLLNDGLSSISHFRFRDEMEKPYSFTGSVTMTYYSNDNTEIGNVSFDLTDEMRSAQGAYLTLTLYRGTRQVSKEQGFHVRIETDEDSGNEVLQLENVNSAGEVFPRLGIPDSGYITVELSTVNKTSMRNSKVFTNRATLTPVNLDFDQVSDGRVIHSEDGSNLSVEATAPVNVVYGYATSSIKRIHELEDPGNKTDSTQSVRYIILEDKEDLFRYTLEVNTIKDADMASLILIDSLPEVDDHSPFDDSVYRNSAFTVSLAENPDFAVTIRDKTNQNTLTLTPDQYTVEYTTATSFSEEDWKGEDTGKWSANAAGARAFRIQLHQTSEMAAAQNSVVSVMFNGRITGEARPGEIAWNSFGYHYSVEYSPGLFLDLEAMPLEVGIKIPAIPKLYKRLVYQEGTPYTAEAEERFTFLVHTGEALKDYTSLTPEMLEGREATLVTVTVPAGATESERLTLSNRNAFTLGADGQWQESTLPFRWLNNAKYTVAELPSSENYRLHQLGNTRRPSYTFTYQEAMDRTIRCENEWLPWELTLTKKAKENGRLLSGAVFALYTRASEDGMADEAYEALEDKPERSVQVNGETWYLKALSTSDADGKAGWQELREDVYYVTEHRAPDGYVKSSAGYLYYRSDSRNSSLTEEITNSAGRILPKTGGEGVLPYTRTGLLLMCAALCGFCALRIRRKRKVA